MFIYDHILQDSEATEENALDFARGFVFGECTATEQTIGHYRHIDSINGIGVYYDYAADYYFFVDECPSDEQVIIGQLHNDEVVSLETAKERAALYDYMEENDIDPDDYHTNGPHIWLA